MSYLVELNKVIRLRFILLESFFLLNRCLISNLFFSNEKNKLGLFTTRIKRICLVSKRGRWVFRFFGMSRVSLKESIADGLVFGVSRSSW